MRIGLQVELNLGFNVRIGSELGVGQSDSENLEVGRVRLRVRCQVRI